MHSVLSKLLGISFLATSTLAGASVDAVSCRYSGWGNSDFSLTRHGKNFVVEGSLNDDASERYTFLLPDSACSFSPSLNGVFTCSTDQKIRIHFRTYWGKARWVDADSLTMTVEASSTEWAGVTYPTRKFRLLLNSGTNPIEIHHSFMFGKESSEDRFTCYQNDKRILK